MCKPCALDREKLARAQVVQQFNLPLKPHFKTGARYILERKFEDRPFATTLRSCGLLFEPTDMEYRA